MLVYAGTFIAVMTAAGFCVCAYDKRAAKSRRGRVSERSLYAIALLGGSLGVFAAMMITKHKISKTKFAAAIAIIMILQASAVIYMLNVF